MQVGPYLHRLLLGGVRHMVSEDSGCTLRREVARPRQGHSDNEPSVRRPFLLIVRTGWIFTCPLRASTTRYSEFPAYSRIYRQRGESTVSRRSKPSSRTALMGEQPNPWDLLQPQDATSRHRGAKPCRRCGLLGKISLLSPGYLLSVDRPRFHMPWPGH